MFWWLLASLVGPNSSYTGRCKVGHPSTASGSPSLAFPCYEYFGHQGIRFVEDFAPLKGTGDAPYHHLVFIRQRKALCPAQANPAEEMQFLGHAVLSRGGKERKQVRRLCKHPAERGPMPKHCTTWKIGSFLTHLGDTFPDLPLAVSRSLYTGLLLFAAQQA